MIRVLIVDDEYLLRCLVRNSIDWTGLGFEIVAEAEDGEDAMKKIDEFKPQLLIVDINIPFINGLELSKIVHNSYPEIKIIILTGYEDFHYAKEAINAGVLSYILKPIDTEELSQALINARNIVSNDIAQKRYISQLQEGAENGYTIAKREFLNMLVLGSGEVEGSFIKDKIKYFNINIDSQDCMVIVFEIDHFNDKWMDESDRQLWSFALNNIVEELFAEYGPSIAFRDKQGRVVTILNKLDQNSILAGSDHYYEVCSKVLNAVKNYFDFTVTVGIGRSYNSYNEICISYREAVDALTHKFFRGNGRIIYYSTICEDKTTNSIYIFSEKDKMLVDLRTGNNCSIDSRIEKMFSEMLDRRTSKQYAQMTAMELAFIAVEFAVENNLQITNVLKTEKDIFDIIKTKETIIEIKEWVIEFYQQVLGYMDKNKKSSTLLMVEKAKKFIEANYAHPYISLEEIAESVFVNPTYLSNIFKKELGYSIVEYLTQYRLKKAKETIDTYKASQIVEVANLVGYTDPYYFSKCFKKIYGLSPSKYIKKKLESTENAL